mmetsp:Transcript_76553/g.219637  ORF Transcript_76553/g.219637 Transcript_76553/m.219637 type:complete len:157 (-) Transcript_76553:247-717(-)
MSGEDLTLDVNRQGVVTCVDASKSLLQEDDLVMKVCEVPWDLSLLERLRGGSKSVLVQRITLYVHEKVPKLKKKRSLPTYVSLRQEKLVLRVKYDGDEHILARGFPEDEAESMSVLAKVWLAKSHLSEKAQEVPDTEYKPGPPRKKRKREQAPQAV